VSATMTLEGSATTAKPSRTLVLNAGYEPLSVVSFRRALVLVMNGRAVVVESDQGTPRAQCRGDLGAPLRDCSHPLREDAP
jgi:hypothetical protein